MYGNRYNHKSQEDTGWGILIVRRWIYAMWSVIIFFEGCFPALSHKYTRLKLRLFKKQYARMGSSKTCWPAVGSVEKWTRKFSGQRYVINST